MTAYQMTIVPSVPAGQYTAMFQGFYRNAVMSTVMTGQLVRKGDAYEGAILQLATQDPDFLNPPPIGKMPDLLAGWVSIRLKDCNTITNVIPFFGMYFASGVWGPAWGAPQWTNRKRPMLDPPDVDLIDVISGGHPITEEYRRLPVAVTPSLLHK
jgi:hypothetical protein